MGPVGACVGMGVSLSRARTHCSCSASSSELYRSTRMPAKPPSVCMAGLKASPILTSCRPHKHLLQVQGCCLALALSLGPDHHGVVFISTSCRHPHTWDRLTKALVASRSVSPM